MLAVITPLSIAVVVAISIGILYPYRPLNRTARTRRALVSCGAYTAALHICSALAGAAPNEWAGFLMSGVWLVILYISIIPFSIFERISEVIVQNRSYSSAILGFFWALVWSGMIYYYYSNSGGVGVYWERYLALYLIPSVISGLVWNAALPRQKPRVEDAFQ